VPDGVVEIDFAPASAADDGVLMPVVTPPKQATAPTELPALAAF
jgi:hypothetical protein